MIDHYQETEHGRGMLTKQEQVWGMNFCQLEVRTELMSTESGCLPNFGNLRGSF